MNTLKRLQNKLDAMALEQLREVAAQLYEELQQTKTALADAEESAHFWRDHVCNLQDDLARWHQDNPTEQPKTGMLQTGDLVITH
jgi:hypothetical protein